MAPTGGYNAKRKATAGAKMSISIINRCRLLDLDHSKRFILEHSCGLLRIYNVCSVKDERAWDRFYDIIFLDPVMTCHFSQFQLV
jgi:hypothetical protein